MKGKRKTHSQEINTGGKIKNKLLEDCKGMRMLGEDKERAVQN